jgi:hypothetical protein
MALLGYLQAKYYTQGIHTDTMDVIRTERKGRHLDNLEKYHIYKISMNNLHMNDTYNHVFQTLHELYNSQQHTLPEKIYKQKQSH